MCPALVTSPLRTAWLLLLLVASPALAQGDFEDAQRDQQAVHAPVQLLLDQFPELMDLSIKEATLDGSPDDAEALVAQMRAYYEGFQDQAAWPQGSEAAVSNARDSYAALGAIMSTASSLPRTVARLAVVDAACSSAAGQATLASANQWYDNTFRGVEDLDYARGLLQSFADALPGELDATPVRSALGALDAWLIGIVGNIETCVTTLEIVEEDGSRAAGRPSSGLIARLQGDADEVPHIRLDVIPSKVLPGGSVLVTGRVAGHRDATVHVEHAFAHLDIPFGLGGYFEAIIDVPPETLPGSQRVKAEYLSLRAEAIYDVVPAETTIELAAPRQVPFGARFPVTASLTSNLALPDDARIAWGDLETVAHATRAIQAPNGRINMTFTVSYPGSPQHLPTSSSITVEVVPIQDIVVEPGENIWETLERGVWYDATQNFDTTRTILSVPQRDFGAGIAVMVTLGVLAVLDLVQSLRRTPTTTARPETTFQGPRGWPRSFVWAFALLARNLIDHRILPRGATPRDVARHLATRRVGMGNLVETFEATRYGRSAEPEDSRPARWLRKVWERIQ